jgi:hypothetical protein
MAIPGIQEIQALATKYSKPQLQKMAQMGLVDPTKAVMAGMMIDRIQKQNMQAPQQTVAEEVMGGPPPMPEGAPAGAPPAAPPAGIAGLPSGLPPQMAGGGIVAFADGGDIDSYAGGGVVGYADRGLVDVRNDPMMRVDPRVQAQRDVTRYQILAEELRQAQARMNAGDPRAKADVEALQREMRSVKPRANVDIPLPFVSEAQAAETKPAAPKPSAPSKTGDDAVYSPEGVLLYGQEPTEPAVRKPEPGKSYEPNLLRDILEGRPNAPLPKIERPTPATEPAKKFEVTPVEPKPKATAEEKEPEIKRPELLETVKLDVPEKPEFTDQFNKVKESYKQAGVDVDLYKKLSDEIKEKKATGAQKRDLALGHAMMAFGFDLFGARQGEVASRISSAGQKSLYQYMSNMDKITENEEKLDTLNRQVQLADQQFKMTGADSAMRRMEKLEDKRTSILEKNAELAYDANKSRATIAADLYRTDKTFQANMNAAAARLASALGGNRGGFTDKQLVDLRAQMEIQYGPAFREQYKDRGNKEQIEKIVSEKIDQKVLEEVNKARGIRASGNIPVPQSSSGWSVSGGVD